MNSISSKYLKEVSTMSVRSNLVEEFESELEELSKMEVGTDTYRATVEIADSLKKSKEVADRIIEIDKIEKENSVNIDTQEQEYAIKAQQLKDEKKDRFIKNCIAIGTFVGGVLVYGLAFIASTNFEREGTLTTEGGKSSLRQLLKLKI